MAFACNVCGKTAISRSVARSDSRRVLFCADCDMGVIEDPPASTAAFYEDGYYGQTSGTEAGYQDYASTAEHALLWARLLVEALLPSGGRILDVGCADGFLLRRLSGPCERFGIEANAEAAGQAGASGVHVLGRDIADPIFASGTCGRFDVITSIATFEHLLDFSGALTTCLGLLEPSGVLLMEVPLLSDRQDSSEWFRSSFEHIYYPTRRGLERLWQANRGISFLGFETEIRGFPPTYVAAATRDSARLQRVRHLFDVMTQASLNGLDTEQTRLNLSYHVVRCFRPNPERVGALPTLLEVASSSLLLKRLTELWQVDSNRAEALAREVDVDAARARAETEAASTRWLSQQVDNWKRAHSSVTAEAAAAKAGLEAVAAGTRWHEEQAHNWKKASDSMAAAAESWRKAHGALAAEVAALQATAAEQAARLARFERWLGPFRKLQRAVRRIRALVR